VMTPSPTDTLCTRCGLCCDGSLLDDLELSRGEGQRLEILGLDVEDAEDGKGALMSQPCGALRGKRCSIYAHRPRCCRVFECQVLHDVQRGALDLERAREVVAEALKRR